MDVSAASPRGNTARTNMRGGRGRRIGTRGRGGGGASVHLEASPSASPPPEASCSSPSDSPPSRPIPLPGEILYSSRQEGSVILPHFKRHKAILSPSLISDFQCWQQCGILVLSLKYGRAFPRYLPSRLPDLSTYRIKVLVVNVDIEDGGVALEPVNLLCFEANVKIILAWGVREVANWIETFKDCEKRSSALIRGPMSADVWTRHTETLALVPGLTMTDAVALMTRFGSLREICLNTPEAVQSIPGIGKKKAEILRALFKEPFKNPSQIIRPPSREEEKEENIEDREAEEGDDPKQDTHHAETSETFSEPSPHMPVKLESEGAEDGGSG